LAPPRDNSVLHPYSFCFLVCPWRTNLRVLFLAFSVSFLFPTRRFSPPYQTKIPAFGVFCPSFPCFPRSPGVSASFSPPRLFLIVLQHASNSRLPFQRPQCFPRNLFSHGHVLCCVASCEPSRLSVFFNHTLSGRIFHNFLPFCFHLDHPMIVGFARYLPLIACPSRPFRRLSCGAPYPIGSPGPHYIWVFDPISTLFSRQVGFLALGGSLTVYLPPFALSATFFSHFFCFLPFLRRRVPVARPGRSL